MDFTHQCYLVTGGASGIGRACVELLLASGAKVAAADRNLEGLHALEQEQKGKELLTVHAELSLEADCERMVHETMKRESRGKGGPP